METQVLETLLLHLLDNKKSGNSKGDTNQKPTLCPYAVLGLEVRLWDGSQSFRSKEI